MIEMFARDTTPEDPGRAGHDVLAGGRPAVRDAGSRGDDADFSTRQDKLVKVLTAYSGRCGA